MSNEVNGTRRILHVCLSIMTLAFTVGIIIGILQVSKFANAVTAYLDTSQSACAAVQQEVNRFANAATEYLKTLQEHNMRMQENSGKFSSILSECLLYMFVTALEEEKILSVTEAERLREQSLQKINKRSPRWGSIIEAMGIEFLKSLRQRYNEVRRNVERSGLNTFEGEMIWAKCNNPACKALYQTSKKAYFKYVEEHANPMDPTVPPMVCEKCGEQSVFRAEKCMNPDCGIVFFRGIVPNDFPDRCPECKRSQTEENRRKARLGK